MHFSQVEAKAQEAKDPLIEEAADADDDSDEEDTQVLGKFLAVVE